MKLSVNLSEIPGIGAVFLKKFDTLGIRTVRDLLYHFPFRYEDWSEIVKIADLKLGENKTIQGEVKQIEVKRAWQRRMTFVEATVADESGEIQIIWFNQPYISKILKPGTYANFAGKLAVNKKNEAYLSNPTYELVGQNETKHTGRLVPIYPETKGLTSKGIRFLMKPIVESFEEMPDFIPEGIRDENKLLEINEALRKIHFPETSKDAAEASYRFAFEEIFLLQLRNIRQKLALQKERAPKITIEEGELEALMQNLPFDLTASQKKAIEEAVTDIRKPHPMNRLLQGDVGSGKTVVAALAALLVAKTHQTAIMAPTEILARQHYKTFLKLFGDFEGGIALMVGKEAKVFYGHSLESAVKKSDLQREIESGKIKIVIGTHTLIQKGITFGNLGLVVIDEQHRFGVNQRQALVSGQNPTTSSERQPAIPHFLSMSATPIPRTMMIALFGDLDLSLINELPKGRKEIITKVIAPENRDKAYAFIRGQVRRGSQVYVICPRIEKPNGDLDYNTMLKIDAKAVEDEYEKLSKAVFPDLRVAMLHGKMKSSEKEKVMTGFAAHDVDILVATSVIEVGVDVPNATIMMIEGAERFGLAQLYQFRGRVGRGEKQSFCFLFTESGSDAAEARLKSLVSAKNGFELAEKDLELRGPGQFLGGSQTGLPDIAMKSLLNPHMIKEARMAAENILNTDPSLENHPLLKQKLSEFKAEIHME